MRRAPWLLLLLAGCAGALDDPFDDPIDNTIAGWLGESGSLDWEETPAGRAPPPATFDFEVGEGVLAQNLTFTITGAQPFQRFTAVRTRSGVGGGRCYARMGGQCLDLTPPLNKTWQGVADATGTLVVEVPLPNNAALAGLEVCFQVVSKAGANGADTEISQVVCAVFDYDADSDGHNDTHDTCPGGDDDADFDHDGQPDACDPLQVTPGSVHLTLDPGEVASRTITLTSGTPDATDVRVQTDGCAWLTVNTGGPDPAATAVPGGGVAQIAAQASAFGLTPADYDCALRFTDLGGTVELAPQLPVTLTVTPPGRDIVFPADDVTTPTNIDAPVEVVVTDEAGAGQAGFPVTFSILPPANGVSFTQNHLTDLTQSTDAGGRASVTLDTPSGFEGDISIDISVFDPGAGVVIGNTRVVQRWERPTGNIYYWQILGGGDILKMPADFSVAPTSFWGPGSGKPCTGCHTASPTLLPNGNPGVFVIEDSSWPRTARLVDGASRAIYQSFSSDGTGDGSSHNDFDPASNKLVYNRASDLYLLDTTTGARAPIAGASDPAYREVMGTFSSDGSHVVFVRGTTGNHANDYEINGSGTTGIYTIPVGGGTATQLIAPQAGYVLYYPELSPDGRWLVYNKSHTDQGGNAGNPSSYSSSSAELWIVAVDPAGTMLTGVPRRVTANNGYSDSWPTWSPDGRFVAFGRKTPAGDWDVDIAFVNPGIGDALTAYGLPYANGAGGQHIPSWGR